MTLSCINSSLQICRKWPSSMRIKSKRITMSSWNNEKWNRYNMIFRNTFRCTRVSHCKKIVSARESWNRIRSLKTKLISAAETRSIIWFTAESSRSPQGKCWLFSINQSGNSSFSLRGIMKTLRKSYLENNYQKSKSSYHMLFNYLNLSLLKN